MYYLLMKFAQHDTSFLILSAADCEAAFRYGKCSGFPFRVTAVGEDHFAWICFKRAGGFVCRRIQDNGECFRFMQSFIDERKCVRLGIQEADIAAGEKRRMLTAQTDQRFYEV